MSDDKSNTWLKNEKGQIDYYINSSEVILVERKRSLKILLDLFDYHFQVKEGLNILDFGCGDGVITKYIYEKFPRNNYFLLDGSTSMLNLAKEKLNSNDLQFINQTFEDYIQQPVEEFKYDFVFSSNAIHHLDYAGKMNLFIKIFNQLKYNGMFINVDLVLPASKRSEELQFKMWIDWMNETLVRNNLHGDIGKHNNLPQNYKSKPENKPSKLSDQLDLLQKAGFGDVDCFYKYSVFAVYGGIKY